VTSAHQSPAKDKSTGMEEPQQQHQQKTQATQTEGPVGQTHKSTDHSTAALLRIARRSYGAANAINTHRVMPEYHFPQYQHKPVYCGYGNASGVPLQNDPYSYPWTDSICRGSIWPIGNYHGNFMGSHYVDPAALFNVALPGMVRPGEASRGVSGFGSPVHHGTAGFDTEPLCVREADGRHFQEAGPPEFGVAAAVVSPAPRGGAPSGQAGGTHAAERAGAMGAASAPAHSTDDDARLENGIALHGNGRVAQGELSGLHTGGSDHRLESHPEGVSLKPGQGVALRGGDRPMDSGNIRTRQHHQGRSPDLPTQSDADGQPLAEGRQHERVHGTLDQARGDPASVQMRSGGQDHQPPADFSVGKTRDEVVANRSDHTTLRSGSRRHGTSLGDIAGHTLAVTSAKDLIEFASQEDPLSSAMHTLTRQKRKAHLPSTDEERAAPLHVGKVSVADVSHIRNLMCDKARERLDSVFKLIFCPKNVPKASSPPMYQSSLRVDDADCLVNDDIATVVSDDQLRKRPTRAWAIPFDVIETRKGKLRRRFILWTKLLNELMKRSGYEADVPLHHISSYLGSVHNECASLRDLKLGFWQVPIPDDARALFRFRDASGRVLEMTRLPMGHSCAPEIMHALTATLAGHPAYAKDTVDASIACEVFIDGIRLSGTVANVAKEREALDKRACAAGITWKEDDSLNEVSEHDWIGVSWDYSAKTVRLADKTASKLPKVIPSTFELGELEALAGRLVYAAGVVCEPLANHYWTMKILRRRINKLNRGASPTESTEVTDVLKKALSRWITAVSKSYRVPTQTSEDFTLFTDAAKPGFGGVLVSPTQEVFVCGNAWAPEEVEDNFNINVLEARAVSRSLQKFEPVLRDRSTKRLTIVVDNTAVQAGCKRGVARSEAVNRELMSAFVMLKDLNVSVRIARIESADNPADAVSRARPVDIDLALRADKDLRHGGGGAASRIFPPS
jgi:hypothetical protein